MAGHIKGFSVSGIYQIVNSITQKRYVGYASNIRVRWEGHKHLLVRNKHDNILLQRVWNKYGGDNFFMSILQECEVEYLPLYEDYWVKVLKTTDREFGYNLRNTNPEDKPGCTEATKEKLRIAHKRTRPSALCIEKKLEALGKLDWFKIREHKRKKVINTITGMVYESAKDAAKLCGISKHSLYHKLSGARVNNTNLQYL